MSSWPSTVVVGATYEAGAGATYGAGAGAEATASGTGALGRFVAATLKPSASET